MEQWTKTWWNILKNNNHKSWRKYMWTRKHESIAEYSQYLILVLGYLFETRGNLDRDTIVLTNFWKHQNYSQSNMGRNRKLARLDLRMNSVLIKICYEGTSKPTQAKTTTTTTVPPYPNQNLGDSYDPKPPVAMSQKHMRGREYGLNNNIKP